MTPVIEAKCASLIKYKQSPTVENLQIIGAARNKVQQFNVGINMATKLGNISRMYNIIKKGPV